MEEFGFSIPVNSDVIDEFLGSQDRVHIHMAEFWESSTVRFFKVLNFLFWCYI